MSNIDETERNVTVTRMSIINCYGYYFFFLLGRVAIQMGIFVCEIYKRGK